MIVQGVRVRLQHMVYGTSTFRFGGFFCDRRVSSLEFIVHPVVVAGVEGRE